MSDPAGGGGPDWWETVIGAAISLGSVTLGVVARYYQQAKRLQVPVDWARMKYEWPSVIGLTVLSIPAAEYVNTQFGVSQGVTAATCFCLGHLGARVFDAVSAYFEKKSGDGD